MKKVSKLNILISIILVISLIFMIYSIFIKEITNYITYLSILVFGISVCTLVMRVINSNQIKKLDWLENRLKLWNSISYRVKVAGEKSFNEMPLGIIVYNDKKEVEWANAFAKKVFQSTLVERKISNICNELYNKLLISDDFNIELYDKILNCSVLRNDNIVFLTDKTEFKILETKYFKRTSAVGILNLDNLDQALVTLDPQEKSMQMSKIIGIMGEWCNKYNIYLRGYSEEQYLLLMDRSQLEKIVYEQFKILDEIREYCYKEGLRITASIGFACEDKKTIDLVAIAEKQLNLALNRGGNQVAVSVDGTVNYYGGKTTGVENRSPIYVRVKTEDLRDLILASSQVFIMTHTDADADAFSSTLAMAKIVKSLNREGKIIIEDTKIDKTITNIYNEIKKEHINLLEMFITSHEAISRINDTTLLIIVDCQYQSLLMEEKIYKKAKNIAILDHHRRSNTAINNYQFLYNQASASSTIELIVEMFEFLDDTVEITPMEATLMLLGVMVDTSNLMYRTSHRTFNVLSRLQKLGAEMAEVQKFLREDFDEYINRMAILNNLEIIDNYGIVVCNDEDIHQRQFLAKITDSIITVNDIKAAFCIGKIGENETGISARSLGETNVQIIMEKMNGGGHFNNAATQLKDTTIEEARKQLIEQLKKEDNGGPQNMKIILIKDVKGKGKAGDIIDIPAGHANYLVRGKQAILATVDNIKQQEANNAKAEAEAEKHLEEMKGLKEFIEKNPITIAVKVGKEGKLFGSVSSKMIIEEYKDKYDVVLDKRKMLHEKDIDSLGTHVIPIQLHREVTAELTIYVTEKE